MNALCAEYYSADWTAKQKANELAQKIMKEIDRIKDDRKFLKTVENKFNNATNGLMAAMRAHYPGRYFGQTR